MRRAVRGKTRPILAERRAVFRTVAGPGATPYPADGAHGNVWYCELLHAGFTEAVAESGVNAFAANRFQFVYVLDGRYLAEGTVLKARQIDGYWFSGRAGETSTGLGYHLRDWGSVDDPTPTPGNWIRQHHVGEGTARTNSVSYLAVTGARVYMGGTYDEQGDDNNIRAFTLDGELLWSTRNEIDGFKLQVTGLVADSDGNLIETSGYNAGSTTFVQIHEVRKFDPEGNQLWSGFTGFWPHEAIAVDDAGDVYVVENPLGNRHKISQIEGSTGQYLQTFELDQPDLWFPTINALAFHGGFFYLGFDPTTSTTWGNVTLAKCDANFNVLWAADTTNDLAGGLNGVSAIAANGNRVAVLCDTLPPDFDRGLRVFDDAGVFEGAVPVIGSGGGVPAIVLDGDDNVYAAAFSPAGESRLFKVDSAGNLESQRDHGLILNFGLAEDTPAEVRCCDEQAGNLYAAGTVTYTNLPDDVG